MRTPVLGLVVAAALFACGCSGAGSEDDFPLDGETASEEALTAGWTTIATGVAHKSTGEGDGIFIGYGGYSVTLDRSAAWTDALFEARLRALHVGHLYAVAGPNDPGYRGREIGNTKLAAHLAGVAAKAPFVLIAAHSSGTYVANELFGQVFDGSHDPQHLLEGKIVYANLDGGGLDSHFLPSLKRALFVWAEDPSLANGRSANAGGMEALGEAHHAGLRLVVNRSGCHSGAKWCLHDLLITTRPHNPDRFDLIRDYTDFVGRPVQDGWIRALESSLH